MNLIPTKWSLTESTVNSRCLKEIVAEAEAGVVAEVAEAVEAAVEEAAAVEAVVVAVGEEVAVVATAEAAADMEAMAKVATVAMAGVAAAGNFSGRRLVSCFNEASFTRAVAPAAFL
jgi:hypothetical protein